MTTCFTHRRAAPAPVTNADAALRALALATDGGRDRCVVLACLRAGRRPLSMFIVDGVADPVADLLAALEVVLDAAAGPGSLLDAVFLAICTPGDPVPDLARLEEAPGRCADAGVELLDLFTVDGDAGVSVAEQAGWAPRW